MRRFISSTSPATPLIVAEVSDADLILEDHEEAADDVAHQGLRAEADGQPGDAGAGQHRRDVDPKLLQDHQGRDADDRALATLSTSEPSVRARFARSSASSPVPLCQLDVQNARTMSAVTRISA